MFLAALLGGAIAVSLLTGCGGTERSPEAYCQAFYETAAPIREGYVHADEEMEDDPLGSIGTLLQAPGDLVVIFSHMADHAPDEIKADTEASLHALEEQQDALGEVFSDPLKALGSGLVEGLTTSGSFTRVDNYLSEHCPLDSELAQSIIDSSG